MENKKTKLTISGIAKKSIKNIEIAKTQGKKSVLIDKSKKNFVKKGSSFRPSGAGGKFKSTSTFNRGAPFKPSLGGKTPPISNDFERRKLAEQRATRRIKIDNEGKEKKQKSGTQKREVKLTVSRALSDEIEARQRSLASVKRAREKEQKNLNKSENKENLKPIKRDINIPEVITVRELANRMAEQSSNVIKHLFGMGVTVTINQTLASSERNKLRVGSIVWVIKRTDGKNKYKITNKPKVEGAIVAIQTNNGAIKALVGGYDFYSNKYNRAIQAYRQPGSAIKPFIFGAALEKGISASTIVNDLPVNFDAESTGGVLWDPSNFNDVYLGPISIKEALTKSQNMVSIRLIKRIDPSFAQGYIRRFGFESSKNPPYFTLALGAGAVTPLQLGVGYSIIANGGYYVEPYFIDRIVDSDGRLVRKYEPTRIGDEKFYL
mgnify:CR=1 FL=1